MTALEAYILARAYAKALVEGAGALKGAPCQIQSITPITGGNRITFAWENSEGETETDTLDVMNGADGSDGVGISSITYKETDAHGNYVYTVTLTDTNTYDIICPKGAQGETGETGATGNGIASIAKTSTEGLVDTYTITYTNGQTTTFTVTNGESITVDSAMSGSSTNPVENKVITEALALKQDAEDNNLTTTSKTVVGAVNELKNVLNNLDNEVNGDAVEYPYADVITIPDAIPANLADCNVKIEPVQDLHGYDHPWVGGAGKNKLPLVLADIKSANTDGTWNGNSYTLANTTYTINTDADGNIVNVTVNTGSGGASGDGYITLFNGIFSAGDYKLNGIANGSENTIFIGITSNGNTYRCGSGDLSVSLSSEIHCFIVVKSGATVSNNVVTPMLRLATETDATFAPYTNVCPITGHTEASVQRTGKNLCSELESGTLNEYGMNTARNGRVRTKYYIRVVEGQQYVVSALPSVSGKVVNIAFNGFAKDDYTTHRIYDSGWLTSGSYITIPSGVKFVRCVFRYETDENITPSSFEDVQLELGSTATPYEPYSGKTYTIALGDTIYGGTVDFDSGVMTVTHGIVVLDGTNNAVSNGAVSSYNPDLYQTEWTGYRSVGVEYAIFVADKFETVTPSQRKPYSVYPSDSAPRMFVGFPVATLSTTEDCNTWLASNNLTVVYPLATPTTIQLTPKQIQLLKGTNTLTASTGQISVTANGVSGAIGQVQEQVNELGANAGGAKLKILKYTGTGTTSYTLDFGDDTPATIMQIIPEPGESVITNNYEYLSGFAWGVPFTYGIWANKSNNLPSNHGGFNISTIAYNNNTCTITGPSASAAANYESQKYAVYYLA